MYGHPQHIFYTASSKSGYLSPAGARVDVTAARAERANISKILAGSMPLLIGRPGVYVYITPLRHLEHSMEHIDSDTRAYHTLTSRFVGDHEPNVSVSAEARKAKLASV